MKGGEVMKKLLVFVTLSFIFMVAPPQVSAIYIVDTGQPNPSETGWTLRDTQWLAGEFTVDTQYTITDIEG